MTSADSNGSNTDTWDREADLVVLGSGGGALAGAVVAAVEGLSVVVLEKAPLLGGTTAISGGGFWVPMNHHMHEVGVDDSRDEALAYVRAVAGDQGDDDVHVAYVDHAAPMARYLEDRAGLTFRPWPAVGGTLDYRPWLEGAKPGGRTLCSTRFATADLGDDAARLRFGAVSGWTMDPLDYYREQMHVKRFDPDAPTRVNLATTLPDHVASGTALIGQLVRACRDHGVEMLTESPGRELLTDGDRVTGVLADTPDGPRRVRARKGVLVATGGYTHNDELKRLWMQRPLDYSCDVIENQGDGHLMGIAVGAQVAGLGDAWWMPNVHTGETGPDHIMVVREERCVPHTLIVNQAGRRFVNEALNYYDIAEAFGTKEGGSTRNLPAWLVYDAQGLDKYSTLAFKTPTEPRSWYRRADTLAELAAECGIDPDALVATVERFNDGARRGTDPDFGRGDSEWDRAWGDPGHEPNPALGTVERGPFHAIELRSGALATCGGLRINPNGQVRRALPPFDPIEGLYAAGNCSNSAVAGGYPGAGATIGAAMTFGYLAAHHAAGVTPVPHTEATATS